MHQHDCNSMMHKTMKKKNINNAKMDTICEKIVPNM